MVRSKEHCGRYQGSSWLKLCLWLSMCFLGAIASTLRADIIDDVDQLEVKKDVKANTQSPSSPSKSSSSQEIDLLPKSAGAEAKTSAKPGSTGKKAPTMPRRDAPIHLQSDGTSTYSRNGAEVRLEKNVVITQDDIRMQSDEARVLFDPNPKAGRGASVQTVEIAGKVNLSRFAKDPSERITARSDKAIFDNSVQKVTLDGNARLWKDGHLIKGDRIVYEILTGMIKVDRAQGVIQPEKAGK